MARRVLAGLLIGFGLLIVLDAFAARMGIAPGAIPKMTGTVAWTTSRAAGVTAFVGLTLALLFGLLVSTGITDRLIPRGRSVEIHRWLSSVVLALIAVHALVLTADSFVQFDVLDALVPFLSSYRSFAVALGVLAAYGALVVHVSFWLRRRIGSKAWRRLHLLSFLVFAVAIGHGLLAGSAAGTVGLRALYLASGTVIASLSLYRGFASRAARSAAAQRAA